MNEHKKPRSHLRYADPDHFATWRKLTLAATAHLSYKRLGNQSYSGLGLDVRVAASCGPFNLLPEGGVT
jgi:hypothetical protein